MTEEDRILARFTRWAQGQDLVRAAILTSTRAVPGAAVDVFSDYDIILVLSDIQPYFGDRAWLEAFGRVLALYRDPLLMEDGVTSSAYVVQFEDGLKIDFSLWTEAKMRKVAGLADLPQELDAGYRVLLDKDGLSEGLKPPAYQGYIPKPPSEAEFHKVLEEFFLTSIYVAKYLWRDDLVAAKHVLENYLIQEHLRPVLEWHLESEHEWKARTGNYMRGIQRLLRGDLYADLLSIYSGAGREENWRALFQATALMRKTALELAERLGFTYPEAMEKKTLAYLREIQNTPTRLPRDPKRSFARTGAVRRE